MSVKIRKATENSLFSFETYTKKVFGLWFNEIQKNMKEQEKLFREKLIKSCVTQFSKDFSIEDNDVEELFKTLQDTCSKHKFGKVKVNCPDFIVNHKHTEEDLKDTETGGKLHDYKDFLFKIKKKKEPTERKARTAVTVYQLFQSRERSKMKENGMKLFCLMTLNT